MLLLEQPFLLAYDLSAELFSNMGLVLFKTVQRLCSEVAQLSGKSGRDGGERWK